MKDITPEQATQRLFDIAYEGKDVEQIPALVEAGGNIHARNDLGETLIYLAAMHNHADAIKVLATAGADKNALCGAQRPIHVAIMMDKTDAVEALVYVGADVNTPNMNDLTPLQSAVYHGCAGAIRPLAAGGASLEKPFGFGVLANRKAVAALIVNGARDPGIHMDEPIVKAARNTRGLLAGTISFADLLRTPGFFIDDMRQCLEWLPDSPAKKTITQQVAARENQFANMLSSLVPVVLYEASKISGSVAFDLLFRGQPDAPEALAETERAIVSCPKYLPENFIAKVLLSRSNVKALETDGPGVGFYLDICCLCEKILQYPEQLPATDLNEIMTLGASYAMTAVKIERLEQAEHSYTSALDNIKRLERVGHTFIKALDEIEQESEHLYTDALDKIKLLEGQTQMFERIQTGALTALWGVHAFNSMTGFVRAICPDCLPEQTRADGFFEKYIQNSGGIILSGIKWTAEASLISAYLMGPDYAVKAARDIVTAELCSFVLVNIEMPGWAHTLKTIVLLRASDVLNPISVPVCYLLAGAEALNIALGDAVPSQQDIRQSYTIGFTVFGATLLQAVLYIVTAASTLSPLGIIAVSLAALTVSAKLAVTATDVTQKILAHTSDDGWIAKQIQPSEPLKDLKDLIYVTADAMKHADEYVIETIGLTKSHSEESP